MKTCTIDGCDKIHRAKGLCSMHWKQQHGKPTRYAITCQTCGVEHMSARPDGKFCSDECKGCSYQKPCRTNELVGPIERDWCDLPERHPARQPQARPRVWYAGSCQWCSDTFVDWQPLATYCSRRCQRRMVGNRSRRRKGYPKLCLTLSERIAIYVRDGWMCWLCMERVGPDLMSTNPNDDWAPSLDHVVPRAHGGSDDADNLRLAHRWCNSVRSDESHYDASDLRISPVA